MFTMFSTAVMERAQYQAKLGELHIQYSAAHKFNASVNIQTLGYPKVSKLSDAKPKNQFVSLSFSFIEGADYILFSIIKIDDNHRLVKATNNGTGYFVEVAGVTPLAGIETQIKQIGDLQNKCGDLFSDSLLSTRSQDLLKNMSIVAKSVISGGIKAAEVASDKINSLLNLEIAAFTNILKINEKPVSESSSSSSSAASSTSSRGPSLSSR